MGEMAGTRDSVVDDSADSTRASSRVNGIVGVLQAIFGLLFLLGLATMVLLVATRGSAHYPIEKWACVALGLEAYGLTYLGLRLRKPWVVPLIILESAYVVMPCLSERPDTLTSVVVTRVWSALALYQLWFFTRPATRRLFGADGMVVL
jgi:hypothetical protein